MAFSKATDFDKDEIHAAHICLALSHPARVRLLKRIISNNGAPIDYHTMTKGFPIHYSTIAQHLQYLRKKGLIQYVIHRGEYCYKIKDGVNLSTLCTLNIALLNDRAEKKSIIKEVNKMAAISAN